jgi:hypothetical protein
VLFCVMCVIVVPLPPGTNPFAVKISNNNNNNNNNNNLCPQLRGLCGPHWKQQESEWALVVATGSCVGPSGGYRVLNVRSGINRARSLPQAVTGGCVGRRGRQNAVQNSRNTSP